MSAGSSGSPGVLLRWQKHKSAHFVFSFLPDSLAEKNVTTVASRAEALRKSTLEAIGLTNLPQERIQVYLTDMPDDGRSLGSGVWEMGGQRMIAAYLSDAQSEMLERAVVELLMTSALDVDADRTAVLIDGMLGHVTRRVGGSGSSELDAALLRLQSEGRSISLSDVLHGPAAEGKILYTQTAASFVTFLLERYGAQAFVRFARAFDPDAPDSASEVAYRKTLNTLEGEWLASLEHSSSSVLGTLRQGRSALGIVGFLRRVLVYLRPYLFWQLLVLTLTAVAAAFAVILPLAFGQVVALLPRGDHDPLPWLLPARDSDAVFVLVAAVIVLFLVQSPSILVREYLVTRLGANVMNDIRMRMFEHLQRLSANYYARTSHGDIQSRFTNDLGLIEIALTRMLPLLVTLSVTFLAGMVSLFFLDWRLALGVLLSLPVLFIIPWRLGKRAAKVVPEQQQNKAMVTNTVQETIGAQQVVKAYGLEEMTVARYRSQLDQLGKSVSRASFLSALPGTSASLSVSFIQVMALGGGAFLVYKGALGIGAMTSFQLLIGVVTGPLQTLSSVWPGIVMASAGMQRVDELLNEKPQVVDAPDAVPLGRLQKEIRFQNVNFSYTGDQVILHDLNLTIPAGQSVAIVGESGSGKSTVLNLIMRFYDPTTGAITVDGQDLREVTQESVRRQIGAVFQETFLYNDTLRENIRLGKTDATDYEVEKAAKAAEIHDDIVKKPQGYDTPVGLGASGGLSGGQKQRIALARTLLYDPAILVLDEPTSALDPDTEAAINATLEKLSKDRTMVMVTHRLASVVKLDRIVVLERGRVAEQGSHEELLRREGPYYSLWNKQNGSAGDKKEGAEASRLRAVPYFKGVSDAALEAIAGHLTLERHQEGQRIFAAGDPPDGMYLIDRGEVELNITDPTGQERSVAVLRDGDHFGESALVGASPRPFNAQTRVTTSVLRLDTEKFLDLLQSVPGLREDFERGVEERRRANAAAMQGAIPAGARRVGGPPPGAR